MISSAVFYDWDDPLSWLFCLRFFLEWWYDIELQYTTKQMIIIFSAEGTVHLTLWLQLSIWIIPIETVSLKHRLVILYRFLFIISVFCLDCIV